MMVQQRYSLLEVSWKKKARTSTHSNFNINLFNHFFKKEPIVADFFTDFPFFIPFLSIIIALTGTVLGFVYFTKTFKAKAIVDKNTYKLQLENAADKKKQEEMSLARELKNWGWFCEICHLYYDNIIERNLRPTMYKKKEDK